MAINQEVISSIASGTNTITYAAAGSTVFLGLNAAEWGIMGVIIGVFITVSTAAFNVWFKMKYQKGD